jgi:predicted metal-dependent hydrolase
MESIAIALITAAGSILASIITVVSVIITSNKNNAAVDAKLDKQQAVIETKIEELTREVREHNNFARRMPVVEEKIAVANHRIDDLEEEAKRRRDAG